MDLQAIFDRGMHCAEKGEYRDAITAYERFIDAVSDPANGISDSQRPPLIRAASFNLAQVLNKVKQYERALTIAELGLASSPSDYGRAIAMSAKGEALCGLGRVEEGLRAFDQAATFHPVVGRLNSADSLARLDEPKFWDLAETRVQSVLASYKHMLDDDLAAETETILGKVAARRGNRDEARQHFEAVLRDHPNHADAQLQLQALSALKPKIIKQQRQPAGKKSLFAKIFGAR